MNENMKTFSMRFTKYTHKQLSEIAAHMGELLSSGVEVELAFFTLSKHEKTYKMFCDQRWRQLLESGKDLSVVFETYNFPVLFVATVKAGEKSGCIIESFERLAEYYQKLAEIRSKTSQALLYPTIILIAVTFSIYFMMVFVMPNFQRLYGALGLTIPKTTMILFALQEWVMANSIYLITFSIVFMMTIIAIVSWSKGRAYFLWFLLNIPLLRNSIRELLTHILVMQLTMLIKGGISVLDAFDNIDKLFQGPMALDIAESKTKILSGEPMSKVFKNVTFFDSHLIDFIEMGEMTGNLEGSFASAELYYNMRMKNLKQLILKGIEPVIILLVGVSVAIIIITMLLPVFDLLENL